MAESTKNSQSGMPADPTRREFLKRSAMIAAAPLAGRATHPSAQSAQQEGNRPRTQPNILIIHSDQFRWDFICAVGLNPMANTPNLDAMYRRGTVFQNFITNQPLCSPSRACLWTGQYATTNGVWKLLWSDNPRVGIKPDAITLATQLRSAGYSANYIGKWHLAPHPEAGLGYVPPQYRGGFLDLWQASNVFELTTHPYHGTIWDGNGHPMEFKNIYRVDYLTDLAEKFLRQKHDKPFLLVVSQLEPHQNNYVNGFSPPHGYAEKFHNPYVPPDLRPFPGDWPYQLANYYGDIKAIDESVGRILKTLKEENLEDNTIVVFMSDHGCHFRTRNSEYKRSPHESSVHVPLMIQGPGFDNAQIISELVSMIDVTPSILDHVGLTVPQCMQGQSFIPLIHDVKARQSWRNEVFVQISDSETARSLRTPEWTYVALAPSASPNHDAGSMHYQDYQLYDNRGDPAQIINLAGRRDPPHLVHNVGDRSITKITQDLRERLIARMVEAGEPRPEIKPWPYYP